MGRAGLNLVDQGLSALTNVVLSFLVARAVDAHGYGAFAVAFLVFSLLIGLERSLVGQPMNIRFSGAQGEERRRAIGAALATVLVITVTVGLVTAATGAVLGGTLGTTLMALGLVVPGLILQDSCRLIFFAHQRPHLAVVNDLAWAIVQFAVMGVLVLARVDQPWPYVLAWGGAATVAAVLGLVQLRTRPLLGEVRWWIGAQFDITGYLLMEYLLGVGSGQGSILLVGAVGSVVDVGSLRAGQTLIGPLSIVTAAIMTFALPEVSRRTQLSHRARTSIAVAVSAVVVVGSLAYAGILLLIPNGLGTAMLGDTWRGASSVLLPMSLASTAAGAALGPAIIIYASGQARKTFRLHVIEAPLVIACMAVGLRLGATPGAAWGMALSTTVMIPLWFVQLRALMAGAAVVSDPAASAPRTHVATGSGG